LKPHIELGAYGWRHAHWLDTFYPADLPADWQLTYYSNAFNSVLVPADYWQAKETLDCESWLEAVHPGFQFFVECHGGMLDHIPLAELTEILKSLRPRLSGLVFLDEKQQLSAAEIKRFNALIEFLQVAVFGSPVLPGVRAKHIWRVEDPQTASFAWIENDLTDLRSARKIVDDFVSGPLDQASAMSNATIIVDHPALQANDLSKFRSLIEIMGY
jgi:uncharacterized protein YecE (DUF72 family)